MVARRLRHEFALRTQPDGLFGGDKAEPIYVSVSDVRPNAKTRRRRYAVFAFAFVSSVFVALVAGCQCIPRNPIESAMVLADVVAGDAPSRLKRTTPQPARGNILFKSAGQTYRADVYRSAEPAQAGLVLVPGAAEHGKDDPRLVAFATTLARARFAVLVPDFERTRRFQLGTNDIHDLAAVLQYGAARPELAPHGCFGVAAMSYAVGPAILAALQPDVRHEVDFVVGVGGYYDLREVVTFFTTGWFRDVSAPGSKWQYREPNAYGKWVFVLSNVGRLQSAADRKLLAEMAQRKLDDLAAPVEALAAQLGPEGRAYYDLLENQDPRRVHEFFQRLPVHIREEFQRLNLANHDLSRLEAKLILFHGRADDIIPYTESLALDDAVGENTEVRIIQGLQHVNVEDIGLRDKLKLWRGMDTILRQRCPRN